MRCNLARILERINVTQGELADRCRPPLQRPNVNKIVNGERIPRIDTALRIARALGLPVEKIWSL